MHGQVHTDTEPDVLLNYLDGEAATAASTASQLQDRARQEEQRLLQAACAALRAKHIIRVCSAHDHPHVCEAIQRLIGNAPAIRQAVDLSGESHAAAPGDIHCVSALLERSHCDDAAAQDMYGAGAPLQQASHVCSD